MLDNSEREKSIPINLTLGVILWRISAWADVMERMAFRSKFIKVYISHFNCLLPIGLAFKRN